LTEELFVILIPSKYNEKRLFAEMTRYIIRPRIAEIKTKLQDQLRLKQGGTVTQLLSQPSQLSQNLPSSVVTLSDEIDLTAEIEKLKRALLAYDGAYSQVNNEEAASFMPGHIADKNELVKWASACSLTQQWGDAGHGHKDVKKIFRELFSRDVGDEEDKYRYISNTVLDFVKNILPKSGLSPGSLLTYSRFFLSVEDCVSKVMTKVGVGYGFKNSGIQSGDLMNRKQALSHCAIWLDLLEDQREEILRRTEEGNTTLDAKAMGGELHDSDYTEEFGDIVEFDEETEKKDEACQNRSRCIHLTNPNLMAARKAAMNVELLRIAEKKIAEAQRLKEKAEQAELDKKKIAERARRGGGGKDNVEGGEKAKTIRLTTLKCANFVCKNTCIKDSEEHSDEWLPCQNKKCNLIFCPSCSEALTAHQEHGH
jgi:hypothetical protein